MMNPVNETDMMFCNRRQCKMMKKACVSRQKLDPKQHEHIFNRPLGCDGCKQGEQIKAELSGKGEIMKEIELKGPYHCNACGSDDKTRQEMEIIHGKITQLCKKCKSDKQRAYRNKKKKMTESKPKEIEAPVEETPSSMESKIIDFFKNPLTKEELNKLRNTQPSPIETCQPEAPVDHEKAKSITLFFPDNFATLYDFLIDHAGQNLRTLENQILWELKCLSESIDSHPSKQIDWVKK